MSDAATPEARWTALYEDSRPLLYRAAALMLGAAEAEEVVQEAFERAMRTRSFFDEVREPVAWLPTVCARQALSRLRRRQVWERLRIRLTTDEVREPWEQAELAIALQRLPARDRVALVLRYYQDASYDEISDAMGIAPASVGPMLTRARAKVREALT